MLEIHSLKTHHKNYPMFGNINKIVLGLKTRVYVGKKISFSYETDSLKELFRLYGLDPNKYTIFQGNTINEKEVNALLVHLGQNHEERIVNLERDILELKNKIK